MELTLFGFQVYTTEVDDRCIDFIARRDTGPFFEVQVKSVRGFQYVFVEKSKFALTKDRLLAAVLLLEEKPPVLYLVPALRWETPDTVFADRDYGDGRTSKPEYGINLSNKNLPQLEPYKFELAVEKLCSGCLNW